MKGLLTLLILLSLSSCSKVIGRISALNILSSGITSDIGLEDHAIIEGNSKVATFTFPKAYDRDVIVQWVVSGPGAAGDIAVLNGTTTVLAGDKTGSFTITTLDNNIHDLIRNYQLSVNVIDPASEVISKTLSVTDNEPLPVVEFTAPTQNVFENALLPVASLTVTPASKFPITVGLTIGGTATGGGVDHSMTGGSFTIPALATTHDLSLAIFDDAIMEALETINLTLTSASTTMGPAVVGAGNSHIATIIDDETSYVSINDITVSEGGVATFTVSVSGTPMVPITFDWTTANGTGTSAADYFTTSGTAVTITPPATTATITVNTRDDANTCETDRTFLVLLSNVTGAGVGDPSAVATITDPDVPALSFSLASSSITEGLTANIQTELAVACATKDISFTVSSTDGTAISSGANADFTPLTALARTITAGSTTASIPVVTVNDVRDENDETLTLTLAGTTLGAPSTHTLTILDNDLAPTISIPATVTHTEGTGAGTANVTYTVTSSAVSDLNITVNYATAVATSGFIAATPADFTTTTGTATITAGATTTTFTIPVVRDSIDEFDEVFNVNLSAGGNYTAAGSTLASVVTITDDDLPPVLSIANPLNFVEGDGTVTIPVTLSAASGKIISFDASSANGTATAGSDYTAVNLNDVTIAAGATTYNISLPVTDDMVNCENTEGMTITLSDLQNATAGTLVSNITIEENDKPILSLTSPDVSEGTLATITPTLNLACPTNVSFQWQTIAQSATPGDDFTAGAGTITFLAGNTNATSTIDVQTIDDSIIEVEENIFVATHNTGPIITTAPGVITIQDNEGGTGVAKVSVGRDFSCALSNQGDVKCWGRKQTGVLGIRQDHRGDEPGEMGNALQALNFGDNSGTPYQVLKIVKTPIHGCALLNNNRLKCWGEYSAVTRFKAGNAEDIGNGLPFVDLGTDAFSNPLQVNDVVVTTSSICALFSNQRIKCWGHPANTLGTTAYLGNDPEMGNNLPFMDLGGTNQVLKIAGGKGHICALLDDGVGPAGDGDVKCWGSNQNGSLGNNGTTSTPNDASGFGNALPVVNLGTNVKATDIAAGNFNTCAIVDTNASGGHLKCWGNNGHGELGIDSQEHIGNGYAEADPLTPVDEMGDNLAYAILGGGRVTNVYMSFEHTCVIIDDDGNRNNGGNLKCWGSNYFNQAGDGAGYNSIGYAPGQMAALGFVNLGTGLKAYDVSMQSDSTCVLTGSGVKCFGWTFRGQVGGYFPGEADGIVGNGGAMGNSLPFVDLGAVTVVGLSHGAQEWSGVVTSASHCAILQGGTAKCWGDDRNGMLFQGTMYVGDGPGEMGSALPLLNLGTGVKVKDIAAGGEVACALTTDNRVKCWGSGVYIGTGAGHWNDQGDDFGEMGNNLPFLDFGVGRTAVSISVGEGHGCAILDNFKAKCWGWRGQGDVQGPGGAGNGGPNLGADADMDFGKGRYPLMMSGRDYQNGCAVLDNLQIKCWGYNDGGQLLLDIGTYGNFYGDTLASDGDDLPFMDLGTNLNFIKVEAFGGYMCALTTDGRMKCWGSIGASHMPIGTDYFGPYGWNLGDIPAERGDNIPFINFNGETVYDFSAHSCAITGPTRALKCWGDNGLKHGRGNVGWWGNEASEIGAGFTALPIGVGRSAIQVSTKNQNGCVLLDDATVKCWGRNNSGQLGRGDTLDIGNVNGDFAAIAPMDFGF